MWERGVFTGVTDAYGGGAQVLPNFWSFLPFMHTSIDAELPNLTW